MGRPATKEAFMQPGLEWYSGPRFLGFCSFSSGDLFLRSWPHLRSRFPQPPEQLRDEKSVDGACFNILFEILCVRLEETH